MVQQRNQNFGEMKKSHLLLLFIISFALKISAQPVSQGENSSVKLYFVFNQPEFAAGDTAFFKAYLLVDNQLVQVAGNKVMNIALYKEHKQVLLQRIYVQKGNMTGYISLPPNIESGMYTWNAELNGAVFESKFIVAGDRGPTIEETITNNSSAVLSDFNNAPYRTNEDVKVSLDFSNVPQLDESTITASIVRDDLFDRSNTMVCKQIRNVKSNWNDERYPSYFSGVVFDSSGNELPDSITITFYLRRNDLVYPVMAGKKGEFEFPLFKNFESDEIFYTINYHGRGEHHLKVVLDDLIEGPATSSSEQINNKEIDAYWDFNNKRKAIVESYNYFLNENSATVNADHGEDYIADSEINMEKYETFSSMADVVISILPAVRYRKGSKRESVRIFLKETAQIAAEDPIYIIDGVMTDSTNVFLSLNPGQIKEIKILRSAEALRRFGNLGRNGILIVKSKIAGGLTIPPPPTMLFVPGLNSKAVFNNSIQKISRSNPDVRSCLYWNPELSVERGHATLQFNTGAITGPIRLIVNGILKDGSLLHFEDNGQIHYSDK